MSVLSDAKILAKLYSKELKVDPCQIDNIQPSSIDLTLGEDIEIPIAGSNIAPPYPDKEEIRKYFNSAKLDDTFTLFPGQFILAQIKETLTIPKNLVGNIQNRNSLIRLGIQVGLSTYINPGYTGKLPIAIHNIGNFNVKLSPGMRICQLVLIETHGVLRDYSTRENAKYHQEQNITLSKISEDKEFSEYVRKFGTNSNPSHLASFLKETIEKNSTNFFENLTEEQKKELGLA